MVSGTFTGFPARLDLPAEVVLLARTLEDAGYETWCVGGALRDALLDAGDNDVDLATAATPEVVRRLFRHTIPVGIEHGTVGVLDANRRMHEVTTFRRDVETNGRHAVVSFGVSLDEDLARRDFTINAIAYHPLRHEWRDPFQGGEDLGRKRIRAVGAASQRFREDYLRILRAIRFAARFEFTIDPDTWAAATEAVAGLASLSAERVRDEWFKGLTTARSVRRLGGLWWRVGAAPIWVPELIDGTDLPEVALEDRDPVVLTALLCLDPVAVLRRLKCSNQDIARAAAMMAGPREPVSTGVRAVRHWLADVAGASADLLLLARLRAGLVPGWAIIVSEVRARGEPVARKDLAIGGDDLVRIGIPPGPGLGVLLDRLLLLVLDDPALNQRDVLLQRAKDLA